MTTRATIPPMPTEQILIGGLTAVLCMMGLRNLRWLLDQTSKGQKLVARFGDPGAARILKLLLLAGALFGTLLATGVINPIRWSSPPAAVEAS